MSSVLLLGLLTVTLVVTYRYFDCQLVHPAVLFTAFFVMAVINGLLNYQRFQFELHWVTVGVIAGGSVLFSLVCAAVSRWVNVPPRRFAHLSTRNGSSGEANPLTIPPTAYVLAATMTCAAFVFLSQRAISTSVENNGPSDLMGAIAYNDHLGKFEGVDTSIRGWLGHYLAMSYAIYYLCAYVFANNLMCFPRRIEWPAAVLMAAHFGLALLSGARQGLIQRIVCLAVMLVLFHNRTLSARERRDGRHQRHMLLLTVACLGVGMVLFEPALTLVGRGDGSYSGFSYLSIYLGAPIKNLDMYLSGTLTHPITATSQVWGEQTFAHAYISLNHWVGNEAAVDWLKWQPYQSIGNVSLGNVYTTYYPFIFDWGIVGGMTAVGVLSAISEYTYLVATSGTRWKGSLIKVSIIAYGILAYGLIFSFFLNFAVTSTVNTGFLRVILTCEAVSFLIPMLQRLQKSLRASRS